jgi:thiol-disulfide isomerase/thioredoxin
MLTVLPLTLLAFASGGWAQEAEGPPADGEAQAAAAFAVDPATQQEAAALFDQMVQAYRSGPLRDAFTMTTRTVADGKESTEAGEFEFLFDNEGRARLDLDELHMFIPGDGTVTVTHEGSPNLYFRAEYEGELTNDVFLDNFELFPFPQLPLVLAEDALWEFFMLAPLEIEGAGEQTVDGTTYRTLVLDGPENAVALRLDPETKLMHWMRVEFKGMENMQRSLTFDMQPELLDEVDSAAFQADVSARTAVAELYELRPAPEPIEMDPAVAASESMEGEMLPVFHLPNLEGETIDSVQLLDQALVLDLWATWCGPCRAALPHVDAAAQQAKAEQIPVRFFAVNVWERAETSEERLEIVRDFWEEQGLQMPVLIDHTGDLADKLRVGGIPFTVVVRPDGYIHAVHVGFKTADPEGAKVQLLADVRAAIEAAANAEKDPF